MSRTPAFTSFFGIGSMPHSGMPGPPWGPAFLSTMTWSGVTSRSSRSISFFIVGVALEDERRAGVLEEALLGGGGLHHAAVRGEVAAQDRRRALGVDRVVRAAGSRRRRRPGRPRAISPMVSPETVSAPALRCGVEALEHAAEAAGEVEILHQVLLAGGPDVGDHRHAPRDRVEIVERERHARRAAPWRSRARCSSSSRRSPSARSWRSRRPRG